jgi:hypothetical protein
MTTPRNIQGHGEGAMSIARLREIMEAYGGSAAQWPAAERGAALALLNRSPEARALRDKAHALDRVLDRLEVPPPSEELESALTDIRPEAPVRRTAPAAAPFFGYGKPAALAASVLIGVCIGFGVGNYQTEPAAERQTVQTLPAEEFAAPVAPVVAMTPQEPGAPARAPRASSGFGSAPLLAGSDTPVEDADGNVPLI